MVRGEMILTRAPPLSLGDFTLSLGRITTCMSISHARDAPQQTKATLAAHIHAYCVEITAPPGDVQSDDTTGLCQGVRDTRFCPPAESSKPSNM